MGGREFRATLGFVLISLVAGAAYRSWVAPDGPTFMERLRAMEEVATLEEERAAGVDVTDEPERGAERGDAATDRGRSRAPAKRAGNSPSPLDRLDVDRARAGDWERLPGIGPALAARIVADRAEHGPFRTPEGLLRVRGIGPRTLERMRPFLRSAPADSTSPFAN
jgi:competence ComEA-like helix-hairpin-helix protein